MKLVSIRVARSIWLVPVNQLNPRGRYLLPAVSGVVERYHFAKPPDLKSLTESPVKVAFEAGVFAGTNGVPVTVQLTLHDDGLVAETRSSTDDSDAFLEDLLSWLEKEYDLPSYTDLGIRKIYASELYVQFQNPISVFSERFSAFADSIETGLGPNQPNPMHLAGLIFGSDPTNKQQSLVRIEREANIPFKENRYYSYAPIKTSEHLKLLELFEKKAKPD